MHIDELRAKINAIDDTLLSRFLERMRLSEQIAAYKREHGLPVLDPAREREILRVVRERSGEYGGYAETLFTTLMELSKARQREMNPPVYGLLGRTLGHSVSPEIHRALGNPDYRLIEREPEELDSFFQSHDIAGLNVTIPYKREVMRYCAALSDEARAIGSVNTLVPEPGGLCGHNTDAFGFSYMARRAGIAFAGRKVLIFGSGGASLTAQYVAGREGAAQVIVISRHGEDNYHNLERHRDAELLINTTPIGMAPHMGQAVVDLTRFPRCRGVLDMVYNPLRTALLMQADALGIPRAGGLPMLVAQAKAAAELFMQKTLTDDVIEPIVADIARDMQNIVLIGMPGCGKSTIGQALARVSGRELVDFDAEIEWEMGIDIPDIFATAGEAAFRRLESDMAARRGCGRGQILVTGGGIVKDPGNYAPLRQNGRIYHITRPVEWLSRAGRPLSQGDLDALHRERLPLYTRFGDMTVENRGTVADAAERIWRDFCDHSCD